MKQKLQNILFLFLLGTMGVNAQGPVITAEGFNPQIGDKIKLQNTNTSSVTPPDAGGANRVWDYSNLKDAGTVGLINFVSPKGLPYSDSFPTANLATADDTTNIEYWQAGNKGWGQVGYIFKSTSGNINLHRANPITNFIVYPMSYKKIYTDSVLAYDNYYDGSTWTTSYTTLYDTLHADGYGTLKLPGATYNNVLRVFSYSGTSSGSNGGGTYFFYANGIHFPLLFLSANTSYNNGVITITSWSAVYYKGGDLPLQISSFTASWQNKMPYLQWNATNTENTKAFNVQRSVDGNTFNNVGQVAVNAGTAYHFADNIIPTSTVYYRLQQVDKTGKFFYSNTLQLSVSSKQFTVFPNPSKAGSVHLSVPAGSQVTVMVYNIAGKLVYENKNFTASDAINTSTWSNGTYTVRVKDNNGWQVITFEKE